MATGLRNRIIALLIAAALIGAAVAIRLWLAATGAYVGGAHSGPLRVLSAVALFAGMAVAGVTVAWPMRKPPEAADRRGDGSAQGSA